MNRLIISASRAAAATAPSLRSAATTNSTTLLRPTSSFFTSSQSYTSSRRSFSDSPPPSNITSSSDDDGELKTGTVKFFAHREGYGFIIPSELTTEKNIKDDDQIFIHRNDIILRYDGDDNKKYYPTLGKGQRVQFKVGVSDDGRNMKKAYDLTLEGGELVPPYLPNYLEHYTRKAKSRFGDEVYDIFSTSRDQKELEIKIVAAYDKVKNDIDNQRIKVMDMYARLGTTYPTTSTAGEKKE